MQVTFLARNVNRIAHSQGELVFLFEFFLQSFFRGFFMITEKVYFFATMVKLNNQNNCIKTFLFSRHKEKQVSMLAASRKDSILGSLKNPSKCKALFPQWNLKTCKFYGVSNTEEQFDIPRKLIPAAPTVF